ncbi:hypothetical protein C7457_0902 [Thermovibrio guaymasensis]|uniref:Uncharacterized protein n=1 Tax=Thermovibrio guaymasensis TaxID=240167 RepID=A0A420W9R0_9BACT|nr:hypothetical protein [Thermovibrio guaymasensis]RKQ64012.1 hypothetical protein C7457_0902 [Thermovibrio guaymasensis]
MNYRDARKGIALLTVLILATIALAFTGVMLYLVTAGIKITGIETRYTSSLEVAKGVSNYLMQLMNEDKLCGYYVNCNVFNAPINLGSYSNFGDYQATAVLLRKLDDPETGASVYAIEVKVTNKNVPAEKAIVDFVYEVE